MMISELTKDRWRRFKEIKRSYYSLILLSSLFILSLFSECIANDKPLFVSYEGNSYFPVFAFYSGEDFGLDYRTEADYIQLKSDSSFRSKAFMINTPVGYGPLSSHLNREGNPPYPPSWDHPLGTDSSGRDLFARLLYGFRICMSFALALTVVTAVLGTLIGGIQGFLAGKTDIAMQRFIEVWSSLPFLYVVILLGSIYGQSFFMLLFVMAIFSWIGISYYMRAEFLRIRSVTYVKSARAAGLGPFRIFFGQILPNTLTPLVTILPFSLIGGIGALTSLDFLGFGIAPPAPSWGELLKQGLDNLQSPWIAVFTVLALFATLLMATFIGEGARDAFDPKNRRAGMPVQTAP